MAVLGVPRWGQLLVLLGALGLAAPPAAADISQDCDGPTPELTICIWDAYETADQELNAVWEQALATIDAGDFPDASLKRTWRERLEAAQQAWMTFRDEDCNGATAYEWYGGSGANAAVGACLYNATVARTEDLRQRYIGG